MPHLLVECTNKLNVCWPVIMIPPVLSEAELDADLEKGGVVMKRAGHESFDRVFGRCEVVVFRPVIFRLDYQVATEPVVDRNGCVMMLQKVSCFGRKYTQALIKIDVQRIMSKSGV